jgi:probable F420-dependent oxidoreductase
MASNAKVGLLVPGGFGGNPPTMAEFNGFFRRADELGYDSLWVIDRIFHNINIIDPMTLMACAAAVTERIRLGTSVLLFVMRNPALVAKTVSTIDYLSGGRVTLGISLGGRDNEYEPMGVDVKRRVGRFTEGLEVMRRLWTETGVTHHGRFFNMDNVNVGPKPVQKPGIPVILGGSAEGVFQRAGELADGWVAGGASNAEAFGQAWEKVQGYARAAGRDPQTLDSGKLMYCYVDDNRERAKSELEIFTHAYYGPRYDVENNCAYGNGVQCAEFIQRYIDAGAKTIILGPTWPDAGQIQRIWSEVVPKLK